MKQFSLSGSPRENVGRKGAAELRRNGRIPGVIYGGGQQIPFSVSSIDWDRVITSPDTLQINIEVAGKTYPTLLQEAQFHPVTDRVVHIDLMELIPGKKVRAQLPVRTFGSSEGVKAGGKLLQPYRKVRVFGDPAKFPDDIQVDITPLQIGDIVRIRDLKADGFKILEAEASAVVSIQATRASIADAAAADAGAKK